MRGKIGLYLVGLGCVCQGCAPLWQSARTSVVQPLVYRRGMTDINECHRNRELAETAWANFVSKHLATMEYSPDFECGFKDGFCDYLFYGGTGAPPPVPPRSYWNFKYETDQGNKAIQNWFAGFRAGAESARASGYRRLVVVPASTCLSSLPSQTAQPPSSPQAAVPTGSPRPRIGSEEILPPPRKSPTPDNLPAESPPATELLPPSPAPSLPPENVPPMPQDAADAIDPAREHPAAEVGVAANPMVATSQTVGADCRRPSQPQAKAP